MKEIKEFTLSNDTSTIKITNIGASIMSWEIDLHSNKKLDVILGFHEPARYLDKHPSFGCIVGRYANRIAKGAFKLNNKLYQLELNNGQNHIHGGNKRFSQQIWDTVSFSDSHVALQYFSEDGESNYPGNLEVSVMYTLTNDNELIIEYHAKSDQDTICNLTNHAYFNLNGESSGNILNHDFQINSSHFLPINKEGIPTGVVQSVSNTVMDFQQSRKIDIQDFEDKLLKGTLGYDHNYVLPKSKELKLAAEVVGEKSGLKLECYTDQPGLQFYIGNNLSGISSKQGITYMPYQGFCLEAQLYPDSPNHSHFPSPILRAEEIYQQKTSYKIIRS